jgi:mono/diheme cytochrome c family protein
LLTAIVVGATLAARDDDAEEREYQLALGKRTFEQNCLICHAEEMTTRQRLTPSQWKTEVDKMVGWGAPVPDDERERLLNYLSTSFATNHAVSQPRRWLTLDVLAVDQPFGPTELSGADAKRGSGLYAMHCATCHGTEGQGGDLGPNLVERPILLQTAAYAKVVRDGLRRMPGYSLVLKPAQEADILAWLRTRRWTPQ